VRTVMKDAGSALMGIGRASGEDRAQNAAREAIASPLLEVNISGAQGVLFNVTGGPSLSLFEVDDAAEIIKSTADPEANIIFGTVIDERMGDEIAITVIATGFDASRRRDAARSAQTSVSPELAAVLRTTRERELLRNEERAPTAIPVSPMPVESENGDLSPAAVSAPRYDRLDVRRGPQVEAEDLDIPAFLRRNR
jgi:cell division protein FtsZ